MYSDDIVHKGFLLSADGSRYERWAGGIHGVADSYCPSHPSVRHICCTPLISPARSIIRFKAFMFLRSVANCPVCNFKRWKLQFMLPTVFWYMWRHVGNINPEQISAAVCVSGSDPSRRKKWFSHRIRPNAAFPMLFHVKLDGDKWKTRKKGKAKSFDWFII